jgi:hypothetical protein
VREDVPCSCEFRYGAEHEGDGGEDHDGDGGEGADLQQQQHHFLGIGVAEPRHFYTDLAPGKISKQFHTTSSTVLYFI